MGVTREKGFMLDLVSVSQYLRFVSNEHDMNSIKGAILKPRMSSRLPAALEG